MKKIHFIAISAILLITIFGCSQVTDSDSDTSIEESIQIYAADGATDDMYGHSVSISSDGTTALVGAYQSDDNGTDSGSAYIYKYNGTNWIEEIELKASDGAAGDYFGYSVSISSDGSVAIIGATREDEIATDAGAVYIYSGTDWSTETKLVYSSGNTNDYFGTSVCISGDGSTAIISAPYLDNSFYTNLGAAFIYSGTDWSTKTELDIDFVFANTKFGTNVSLSYDGSVALVGAMYGDPDGISDAGFVSIFSGSSWLTRTSLLASDYSSGDNFGSSVCLSSDGSIALVGAYNDDNSNGTDAGATYLFSGTNWSTETKLTASDGAVEDGFGFGVSLSSDGNVALVGAFQNDNNSITDSGSAYLYSGSGWSTETQLNASSSTAEDYFGRSLSISSDGSQVLIGSRGSDGINPDSGTAYAYSINY